MTWSGDVISKQDDLSADNRRQCFSVTNSKSVNQSSENMVCKEDAEVHAGKVCVICVNKLFFT